MGGRNIPLGSIKGIPILVNPSWIVTLFFITALLALRLYPDAFNGIPKYEDDRTLHWAMAVVGALTFFVCIVLHELAHSLVALRQGIAVRGITFFIFGGMSQVMGEATRPRNEFVMAFIGPLTSLVLGLIFLGLFFAVGGDGETPVSAVLESIAFLNVTVAVFNMLPGFPMDGGRVLRSVLWGVTGNMFRATRLATLVGRGIGYAMMIVGFMTLVGIVRFIDPLSGAWLAVLGLFLESSASTSWFNARALEALSKYKAEDIMETDLETAERREAARFLMTRGGRHFIYFVSDDDEQVVGVLTEKQTEVLRPEAMATKTAGEIMVSTSDIPVVEPADTGATILQRMESDALWHLPVVSEGRVVGVVSRENILRIMARAMITRPGFAS